MVCHGPHGELPCLLIAENIPGQYRVPSDACLSVAIAATTGYPPADRLSIRGGRIRAGGPIAFGWNGADAVQLVKQYPVGLPGLEGLDFGVTGVLQVYGMLQTGDLSAGVLQHQGSHAGGALAAASRAASFSCHWPPSHVSKASGSTAPEMLVLQTLSALSFAEGRTSKSAGPGRRLRLPWYL